MQIREYLGKSQKQLHQTLRKLQEHAKSEFPLLWVAIKKHAFQVYFLGLLKKPRICSHALETGCKPVLFPRILPISYQNSAKSWKNKKVYFDQHPFAGRDTQHLGLLKKSYVVLLFMPQVLPSLSEVCFLANRNCQK